jgi:hypothetical protein
MSPPARPAAPPDAPSRTVVRLLAALVALVALLVAGLAAGGVVVARQVARLGGALEAAQEARAAAAELTARQERAAQALARESEQTHRSLADIARRYEGAKGIRKGPLQKLDQMILLQQLMVEEQAALLRHTADTQAALSRTLRPLPTQKEHLGPGAEDRAPAEGVGGSGPGR